VNGPGRLQRYISGRSRTYHIILASVVIVAGLISQVAAKQSAWWYVSVISIAMAGLLQVVVGWLKSRATEAAETEALQALQHQIGPVAQKLGELAEIATPTKRRELYSALCMQVVAVAAALPTKQGVRASLYRVSDVGGSRAFVPHPAYSQGREDRPRTVFVEGRDAEGNAVWADAVQRRIKFCRDVDADPPPGYDPQIARAYRTFITAPIVVDGQPVGLLTNSATRPGDLTDQDERTMSVLAHLLAVAYVVSGRQWPSDGAS